MAATMGANATPKYMGLSGKPLKVAVTVAVMFGFVLIGYDQGVMSALLTSPIFLDTFPLLENTTMSGLITAIYDIGCFLGALSIFFFGDYLGRRRSLLIGSLLCITGVTIQITAFKSSSSFGSPTNAPLAQFTLGRVITGVGNGIIITTLPTYQSECYDQAKRGVAGCIGAASIPYGTFLSYWLNFGIQDFETSFLWRFPIGFQLFFTFGLFGMMFFLPETPRWLLSKGKDDEGTRAIAALNGELVVGDKTQRDRRAILDSTAVEKASRRGVGYLDLFTGGQTQHFRRMVIGVSSQFFQQIGGCNAVIYYCPILLRTSLGMSQRQSLLIGGVNMAVYAIFGSVSGFFIESAGRRPLFLAGTTGQMVAMIITFACLIPGTPAAGNGAVFGLFLYIASFASSYLTVPWLYAAEVNPLATRAKAVASANVVNWLTNFLVVMVTPIMVARISWGTYLFFGVVNACFLPAIWLFYPETKGRSLEEIDFIFAKGFNENMSYVKAAKEMPFLSIEDIERLTAAYGFTTAAESSSTNDDSGNEKQEVSPITSSDNDA